MVEKIKSDINLDKEKYLLDQKISQQKLSLTSEDIKHFKESLPNKKYYEFMYHSFFHGKSDNLAEFWKNWKPWDIWEYPIYDLNRFNIIITKNANLIRNKKILDVGCNIGYLSLFCLNLDCKNVTGIDVRSNKLQIADFVCGKAGFTNYEFKKLDIIQDALLGVTEKIDTILFSGLIYHISNHYEILAKLSKSTATSMIIENYDSEYYNDPTPQIYWLFEDVEDPMNAYSTKHKSLLVGRPNQAWINTVMTELGWKLKKVEYLKMHTKTHPRCCSVFER